MILINSVEYIEVDGDSITLRRYNAMFDCLDAMDPPKMVNYDEFCERVKGRRFRRPDGMEIVLGFSGKAAEAIGIQYDAWDELNNQLVDQCSRTIQEMRNRRESMDDLFTATVQLLEIGTMTFWARLKFLFTGRIPS